MGGTLMLEAGGDDSLSVCRSTIAGDLSLKGGKPDLGSVEAGCEGGTVTISLTDGGTAYALGELDVGGDLVLKGSSAREILVTHDVTVGGAAKFGFGGGNSGLGLCETDIAGALTIKLGKVESGSANVHCTGPNNSSASSRNAVAAATTTVGGETKLKGGAPSGEAVHLVGNAFQGRATFDIKAGLSILSVANHVFGGDLRIKTGKGTDIVLMETTAVAADGSVKTRAGNDVVNIDTTTFGGDLEVATGVAMTRSTLRVRLPT